MWDMESSHPATFWNILPFGDFVLGQDGAGGSVVSGDTGGSRLLGLGLSPWKLGPGLSFPGPPTTPACPAPWVSPPSSETGRGDSVALSNRHENLHVPGDTA